MEGLILFTAVIVIFYIIYWSIQNDRVKKQTEQKGFLRMRIQNRAKGRSN